MTRRREVHVFERTRDRVWGKEDDDIICVILKKSVYMDLKLILKLQE